MSTEALYKVTITTVAESRYIKKLSKRHKPSWSVTMAALVNMIERIDALLSTSKAHILNAVEGHRLVKIYFTIARSKQSAKASGHRCIVYLNDDSRQASILLVYSKHEISSPNETAKIREQIKSYHRPQAVLFNF